MYAGFRVADVRGSNKPTVAELEGEARVAVEAFADYHHPVDSVAVRNARLARFSTARGGVEPGGGEGGRAR